MENENKNLNQMSEDETFAKFLVKEYAKQSKRFFVALIVSVIINLLVVGAFLLFISQYDIESTEIQQDGQGINNYIGGDGDNINGATSEENEDAQKKW